jgi:hypothetical protein
MLILGTVRLVGVVPRAIPRADQGIPTQIESPRKGEWTSDSRRRRCTYVWISGGRMSAATSAWKFANGVDVESIESRHELSVVFVGRLIQVIVYSFSGRSVVFVLEAMFE